MRAGFCFGVESGSYQRRGLSDEDLRYAAQLGARDIICNSYIDGAMLPGDQRWELDDIVRLRKRVESFGLSLHALENVPTPFYDDIMLNGAGCERQIENMIFTIRNIARAGIPGFGYHWMPSAVWRTSRTVKIRGGADATAFEYTDTHDVPFTHGRDYDAEEIWTNLERWVRIITPIAEEEGIHLGVHPCDPPVEKIAGMPMVLSTFESFRRLIELVDSPANSVEFCQGTFAEMADGAGEGIYDMIRYFAGRKRILYVHLRNVSDTVPSFHEEFINTGYVDMVKAIRTYKEAGFEGVFVDDHVPVMDGDTPWGHTGRAFANGYIQALLDVANAS